MEPRLGCLLVVPRATGPPWPLLVSAGLVLVFLPWADPELFLLSDTLTKADPSSAATAAPTATTATYPEPVSAAATAPAAAPTPALPTAGPAPAVPDGHPACDDDTPTCGPAAAQKHPHQPPLQGGGGGASTRCVSGFHPQGSFLSCVPW